MFAGVLACNLSSFDYPRSQKDTFIVATHFRALWREDVSFAEVMRRHIKAETSGS